MNKDIGETIPFPTLNLPKAELPISKQDGKWYVFDPLRKKSLMLTPEEWVRQHIIYYLWKHKDYPKGLFVVERGLHYNQLNKRLDILIQDRQGAPFLLVECKAPSVKLSQSTLEQVCMYNRQIGARYLAISNGLKHVCLEFSAARASFIPMKSFPDFTL
jgi:hypothetical protein